MKTSMNWKRTESFALVAALAFAVVGVYLAATRKAMPVQPAPSPVAVPAPAPQPSPADASYAPPEWKVWRDGELSSKDGTYLGYAVSYPRDFDVATGDQANGGLLGSGRVKLAFPQDAFREPRTNYAEAFMTVSVGADKAALSGCYDNPRPDQGGATLTDEVVINGATFKKGSAMDAGAGNFYDAEIYRALRGGRCYEIALTVHTTNIANYDPGTVTEFDKGKALTVLHKMLTTFVFTDKSPYQP